jgi:hypothetical protein
MQGCNISFGDQDLLRQNKPALLTPPRGSARVPPPMMAIFLFKPLIVND